MKKILTLAIAVAGTTSVMISADRKPNIIFIVTDDQPEETLGCFGGESALTPNIDRLASQGMRFSRAYCPSSISAASRYAVLSGRYCGRCEGPEFMRRFPYGKPHRIDNMVMSLEPGKTNLQTILKQNGYFTGMVGKWHLGEKYDGKPEKRKLLWNQVGLKYYDQNADPSDPAVKEALEYNHRWYADKIRATGFDYADNVYWGNLKEVYNDYLNFHNIDWTVKGAFDFMEQAGDRPFFLYFSTTLHHGPTPQNSIPSKYERVTSKGYSENRMLVLPDRETLYERMDKAGLDREMAFSLWLDDAVGALLEKLDEIGELDNTLIFYFSDHGIDMKSSMYEGGIKTPLIVWGKNIVRAGKENSNIISLCDLAPTCLDAAGIEIKDEYGFDGSSLLPTLKRPHRKIHNAIYSEIGYARCVTTERFKYIAVRYPEDIQGKIDRGLTEEEKSKLGYIGNMDLCRLGKKNPNYFSNDQLYDLENDPDELENLAADPRYRHVLEYMRQELTKYLETFKGRPFYDLYDGK